MIRTRHGYVLLLASGVACSAQPVDPDGTGAAGLAGSASGAPTDATSGTSGAPNFAGGAAGTAPATGGTPAVGGLGGAPAANAGQAGAHAGTAAAGAAGVGGGAAGSATSVPVNLALNHCDKAGCTAQWTNDPCNAFDGDLTTATGSAKSWDSSLGTLAVDFGAVRAVTKVVVSFEDNADPNPGYALEGSSDGQSWTLIRDVTNPSLVDTQVDLKASYRYLRVHSKQFFFDPWWMHSVREVEVW